MVKYNLQTEMLLELVFSSYNDSNELTILKKSIPLYLRKLNCFSAGVLKYNNLLYEETLLIPYVYKKSKDWEQVKAYFISIPQSAHEPCSEFKLENTIYYAYNLTNYGILILGRKKPFNINLANELKPIINHLGIKLSQAHEKKQREIAEKSLIENEKCLRTLLNTTAASILIYHNNSIIYANNSAEQFTGYNFRELVDLKIYKLIHPDFKTFCNKLNTSYLKENKTLNSELKILKKDKTESWINVNIDLINWKGLDAIIISAFDITQLKLTEQNLINAKEEAEKSERLKTAFLANISHEIRTPMSGILGFTELLKTPHLTSEKREKYIEIIEKSGDRMLNLINNIIDISKIEASLMLTSYSDFNINEQINNLFNFFTVEAENKNLKLIIYKPLPNNLAVVNTDYEKFYAIFTNLIKNSIKYTEEGLIEFGYDVKDDNSSIVFYVKDSGMGIASNRQDAIFERFIQADIEDTNTTQGAGLGLSISKAFVEMLGGEIWVKSVQNVGSTFFFSLPYNNKFIQ
ncbi:PAS domain-containing sensor histidine kinase [Lutibacter citreus]|uniref:PAS domain-containing sensor histidine kinase n=1 Tax=Lutibacter citreus TaxID=2138210 RepID=UPI000DBE4B59|nr:histidine kinase dimerization/phospho-acceptor domain-containing protein [Lutibacter citreus]